uniref:PKD domain-containing protein n=1 Tax=Cynoglossus semilaevis TaxID=244447 RepID=A0A3P8UCB6_CYNSE
RKTIIIYFFHNILSVITHLVSTFSEFTHTIRKNIAGKLTFYQMDGNSTYVRNTGELASDVPTETMFELFDPLQNFSSAKFSYTWDLGNGEVIQGTEPVVRYLYTHSGNYTLQLKVGVNLNKSAPEITEVYSTDLKVLGEYIGCTMTKLYENTLRLNHTFTSAGVHCLDISVSNDISKLQTSFSLYAKKSNNNHLIFMLSCAAVLTATFSFITVIACRPCHHGRSQVKNI